MCTCTCSCSCCVCFIIQVCFCLNPLREHRWISAAESLEITRKWEQEWEIYKLYTVWIATINKKKTQWMFMCTCVSVYMDILVSCMNDHTFLPTTTWLYLEISEASHNEVCRCERHLLSSGSLGASVKMQYHAIWHSIIRHIAQFPEREWWQSPYAHFNRIS